MSHSPIENWRALRSPSTEDLAEHLAQGGAVFVFELPELAQHEAALDGGDDGLEHRGSEQAGLLPLRDGGLAEGNL